MKLKEIRTTFTLILIVSLVFLSGCDYIYRLLQKEGAEERDLLGEFVPSVANTSVEEVQKLLKLYGYRPGRIDGQLGLNTRNALEKFQKDNGLETTRFVDQNTWEKLNMFTASGLVANGEVNIRMVQTALKSARCDPGATDGRPGQRTLEAIKRFQKTHQLKADGNIGYKTLNELVKYLPAE